MKKFRDYLKFIWRPGDVEHEKDREKDRASRFIWKPGDVEHHPDKKEIKEEILDEKFKPAPDHPGNYNKPHQITHDAYALSHPYNKPSDKHHIGVPEKGSDAHEAFLAHHESLSDEEHGSGRFYKGSGAWEINKHLRETAARYKAAKASYHEKIKDAPKFVGDKSNNPHDKYNEHQYGGQDTYKKPNPHYHDDDYHDEHIHNLDSITNHRTTEHHIVFRGGHPGDKTRFPVGHEFTDHGYISTSFRHDKARGFAEKHAVGEDPEGYSKKYKLHVHVLHVPQGSRAHYFDVKGYSDEDTPHYEKHHHWGNPGEKELVLHRGTKFKVTHHTEDADTHYIHSRVIKQGIRHNFGSSFDKRQSGNPKQGKFPFMKSK